MMSLAVIHVAGCPSFSWKHCHKEPIAISHEAIQQYTDVNFQKAVAAHIFNKKGLLLDFYTFYIGLIICLPLHDAVIAIITEKHRLRGNKHLPFVWKAVAILLM